MRLTAGTAAAAVLGRIPAAEAEFVGSASIGSVVGCRRTDSANGSAGPQRPAMVAEAVVAAAAAGTIDYRTAATLACRMMIRPCCSGGCSGTWRLCRSSTCWTRRTLSVGDVKARAEAADKCRAERASSRALLAGVVGWPGYAGYVEPAGAP